MPATITTPPTAPQTATHPATQAATPTRVGWPIVAVGPADAGSVLDAARQLAPALGGHVLALAVLEPLPAYMFAGETAVVPEVVDTERSRSRLARLEDQVMDNVTTGTQWRAELVHGEPAITLADEARARKAPMIIMGIGRHRPVDRLLGGETALKTIRRAPCPVLAVSPNFPATLRDVVIATDFSAASARAAEAVVPLLADPATVHLVHVWEPSGRADSRLRQLDDVYAASLPGRFRRFRESVGIPSRVEVKEEVREGKIAERLLDYANAHHADLIVAGRQGMNRLARLVVGSVTTGLLRGANCSVFIAPEPSFVDRDRFRRLLEGTSESRSPEEWAVQLDEFTRRNHGRRTTLEVDDVEHDAQVRESGYRLRRVSCDPRTHQVEITLASADGSAREVTRRMAAVVAVTVVTDRHGLDTGLRIDHAPGHTILALMDEGHTG